MYFNPEYSSNGASRLDYKIIHFGDYCEFESKDFSGALTNVVIENALQIIPTIHCVDPYSGLRIGASWVFHDLFVFSKLNPKSEDEIFLCSALIASVLNSFSQDQERTFPGVSGCLHGNRARARAGAEQFRYSKFLAHKALSREAVWTYSDHAEKLILQQPNEPVSAEQESVAKRRAVGS